METVSYTQHSVRVLEHRIRVPLNHGAEAGPEIEIFARELIREGGENLPHLLFLQGGPGGAGPRFGDFREGWTGAALEDYRVVLLDQRGTGQSTPFDIKSAPADPHELAEYLRLLLQDQIIRDAEAFREALNISQWSTLGQSYGGFLTLAYLSRFPEAIREAFITGGLPGLVPVDDIYSQTYPLTVARNKEYFRRYPQDEQTVREVARHLEGTEEVLPTGERLTPTRLRTLGMSLGTQTSFDTLHYLFEGPFITAGGTRRLSDNFLAAVGSQVSFAGRPLYAALHESIYASTTPGGTRWAADRLAQDREGFELDAPAAGGPWYFTGEHIFRSLFEEDPVLRPLLAAADLLAQEDSWPEVYLPEVLRQVETPIAAAIYYGDMFVPRELSLATAEMLPGVRTLITNEFQHDGLRAGDVFARLRSLAND